jgi:two-component system cell cycle sensor histidine kinase/response regulator CckA
MPPPNRRQTKSPANEHERIRPTPGDPPLRESEERFRTAFDRAAIGMAMAGPDGAWTKVNARLCELLGYSAEELLGRRFLSFAHPDDRESDEHSFRDLLAGNAERVQLERRFLHRDGHVVWLALSIAVIRGEGGAALYTLAQMEDITERIRVEQDLREREALLRGAFDDAPIGMALTAPDGRWVRVNKALCEILGYSEAGLLATTFQAITHPDDLPVGVALHQRLLAGEHARYQYEKRYVHRLGHHVWASVTVALMQDEEGKPRHQLVHIQDVTERVRTEALRRGQTETLQAIFDHIPAMVAVTSSAGQLVFANAEWTRVIGWTLDEVRDADFLARLYPDVDERTRAIGFIREATGSPSEFAMCTRDGRTLRTTWACVALSDGSILGLGQDVTERCHLEAQLRHAQKMEAVGRLAGGVAHDFNNLLTVIQSNAYFLLEDIESGDVRRQDVLQIRDAGDRAAALTRQLLAYSRQQLLQPRVVDLNRKVENVVGMLRRVIGEDIILRSDLAPTVWPVFADPGQLEQVLMNLAVNARDAMPAGGTLTLRTTAAIIDAAVARSHPGLTPGQYVSLEVEDTGLGIPPDVLPHIFEPFYTTKSAGKGTGLGLATVYGIVKQSEGYIYVESTPGKGSRFTMLLPRHTETAGKEPTTAALPPRGTERILLVEDEPPVRATIRRMLERLGYRVIEAESGAEALGALDTYVQRIDLVLTDVVMPDVDGRLLVECIAKGIRAPRVLYMSGYMDDDILRRGLTLSGTVLLQKPFTLDALAHAVRRALDGQRATAS